MRTLQNMSSSPTQDLRLISIFELSDEELTERLRPTYDAMKKEKFEKGGYVTYYDPLVCPTTSHAVHEFSDRKELMWVDKLGKIHFVKAL